MSASAEARRPISIEMRLPYTLLSLAAFTTGGLDADGCDACQPRPADVAIAAGSYTIPVLAVLLADDDGSHAARLSGADLDSWLQATTAIYQRSGAPLVFVRDPRTNLAAPVRSTVMNHDCVTPADIDLEAETDRAADPEKLCSHAVTETRRYAYALEYPGAIVVLFRYGADAPRFDEALGHWIVEPREAWFGYSGAFHPMVVGGPGKWGPSFLAHEIGHYFALACTHGPLPASVAAANALLAASGPTIFDGDGLDDTAPDPGATLFTAAFGTACDRDHPTIDLAGVTFAPDRANTMAYYDCSREMHLSAAQVAIVMRSLTKENRQPLIHPELGDCYEARDIHGGPADDADRMVYRYAIIDACVRTLAGTGAFPSGGRPYTLPRVAPGLPPVCEAMP
jgi:hypothetical protein